MPQGIQQIDPEKRFRRVMGSTTLAGDSVRNRAGDDLGKIKEIMIDVPTGRVAYAVLSFGGFMKIGSKLFAVPWNALTLDEDQKRFILNMEKSQLENAPGFDNDNWPDMADTNWGNEIYRFYGTEPAWGASEDVRAFRGGGR